MGRGRKRRKHSKRNRAQRQSVVAREEDRGLARLLIKLAPLDVELAAAHDGFLRGGVEVRIVASVIVVRTDGVALMVARQLWRSDAVHNRVPQTLEMESPPTTHFFSVPFGASIVVALAAYEEDGGDDVKASYRDMEHCDALTLWRKSDVAPLTLDSMSEFGFVSGDVYDVELAVNGRAFSDGASDKWIGAGVARFDFERARRRLCRHIRFPFAADDGRNAWTVRAQFEYG